MSLDLWQPYLEEFCAAMDDDFNTAKALAVAGKLKSALHRYADDHNLEGKETNPDAVANFRSGTLHLRTMFDVLGLFQEPPAPQRLKEENRKLVVGLIKILTDLIAKPETDEPDPACTDD